MRATTYTFTASNVLGSSAGYTLTFVVSPPAASACTLTTPVNTAQTVDLATCMYPGTTPTGFTLALSPTHGTAAVAAKNLTYTPANNFFGTDAVTVVASYGNYPMPPVVIPISITGRPDPVQNVAVTGLVANQTQTAIRFSQAQVSNFGRHMEGLRRPGGGGGLPGNLRGNSSAVPQDEERRGRWGNAGSSGGAWGAPAMASAPAYASGGFGANAIGNAMTPSSPLSMGGGLGGASNATQLPTGTAPTASLPVESGVMMALNKLDVPGAALMGQIYNFDKNRKLDLGALKAGFNNTGETGTTPGNTVWVEGVVSFGSRDASGTANSAEFSSNGVSVGMDIPVSERLTLGMGFGLARDVAYIGTDGSRNQSQGYSLATYGSYKVDDHTFVEGMLGVGTIDYDMRRWVDPVADFATSNRKGLQLFGSIGGGLEYREHGRMISPYVRLDFSQDKLQEVSETGAGSYALHYFDQTNSAAQGVLGLRGEATHSTSFGWVVPRARVEWRQDLQDGSDAVISYADQIGGTRYSIAPTDSRRSAFVMGMGSEFLFRDGWALGLDYQLSRVSSTESSYALRLRVSKQLGAKGMRKLLNDDEEDMDIGDITVDSGITWDDNVTRAKVEGDIRADTVYTVNISQGYEWSLSPNTRVLLSGIATGERFQNFNGLSRYALGAEATLQYRSSAEFDTPTWGLNGKITGEDFQSTMRDGTRATLGVNVLVPVTDRINLFGAMGYNNRTANSTVFSTNDAFARMNVDYTLRGGAALYFSGEYRDGDIVSTGRSSLENIATANVLAVDDAFPGGQLFAYRMKGTTVITTIGYNIGLGARDSLDISWRLVQATPNQRPAWATTPSSYITNQISASYLMRF
jgi:uncharacterized protein YhjY with autotransporter beta-barrel domain